MLLPDKMKESWKQLRHGRFFRYVPLILCLFFILYASTTNASMSQTSRFIRPLLEFLFPDTSESTLYIYHTYIRKFAHFTEYAGLAFFASRAFFYSSKQFLKKYWYISAFLLVLTVASVDEINQSFDVTRTGTFKDVLIDGGSGLVMILMLFVFYFRRK